VESAAAARLGLGKPTNRKQLSNVNSSIITDEAAASKQCLEAKLHTAALTVGNLIAAGCCHEKASTQHSTAAVLLLNKRTSRNLSSHIDLHAHAGKAFDNRVTLTFDLLTSRVNARRATAMHCMSTKFGVDSASCFSFRQRTHTQVTDAADHRTHASATFSVGNYRHTARYGSYLRAYIVVKSLRCV